MQGFANGSGGRREEPRQPRSYDAVLGGRLPAPPDSALLGGLDGVRERFASPEPAHQVAALGEAMRYGVPGLELVLTALETGSPPVQWRAYQLLRYHFEPAPNLSIPAQLGREVLAELRAYDPWALFTGDRWPRAHAGPVTSLALSPDGRLLASGSHDKRVKVWDLAREELRYELAGHSDWVSAVAIAPDNRTLVSGSVDRTIKIWDLKTGALRHIITSPANFVKSLAIGPDSRTVVSGGVDRTLHIWDLTSGETLRILAGHTIFINSVAIAPDGGAIAGGSADGTIKVWDFRSGRLHCTLQGLPHLISAVCFSPDGRSLLSSSHDKTIQIWDLPTRSLRQRLIGHLDAVDDAWLHPDGSALFSAGLDGAVNVWELRQNRLWHSFKTHDPAERLLAVVAGTDGRIVVAGSEQGAILRWRAPRLANVPTSPAL